MEARLVSEGRLVLIGVLALSVVTAACSSTSKSSSGSGGSAGAGGGAGNGGASSGGAAQQTPVGVVVHNASEAWPDRPAAAPALDGAGIARACGLLAACSTDANQLLAVDYCVGQVIWSAERAIPLSSLFVASERAEFWVLCVTSAVGNCAAINACRTERPGIYCEEDGCRSGTAGDDPTSVTCSGTTATITRPSGTSERDCARALASCDTESPTGCTDRLFTACAADAPSADWCDGDVLAGCDGRQQFTYHDCARMSGRCEVDSAGNAACVYQSPPDAECGPDSPMFAACTGNDLSVCVNGERVTLALPELCATP